MDSETLKGIIQFIIALAAGGGLVALFLAPWQARKIRSETGMNHAQIEINLSTEARRLLEFYQTEVANLKTEVKEQAEKIRMAERETEKAEARTDFLVHFLREQAIKIPEWPERLR